MTPRLSVIMCYLCCAIGVGSVFMLLGLATQQRGEINQLQDRIIALESHAEYELKARPIAAPSCGAPVCAVSPILLAAHPYRYDGQVIELTGHYVLGMESTAVYPGKDLVDPQHGVWVSPGLPETSNGHRIVVSGRFKAGPSGHMGQFVGELNDLVSAQDLEDGQTAWGTGFGQIMLDIAAGAAPTPQLLPTRKHTPVTPAHEP